MTKEAAGKTPAIADLLYTDTTFARRRISAQVEMTRFNERLYQIKYKNHFKTIIYKNKQR